MNNLPRGKRVAKCPCLLIHVCSRLLELLNIFRCSEISPTLACTQSQVTYLEYTCTRRQYNFTIFLYILLPKTQIISGKMQWHWSVIWSARHELMWKNFTLANIIYTVRKVSNEGPSCRRSYVFPYKIPNGSCLCLCTCRLTRRSADRLWGPPNLLSNGYLGFFPQK
jgi:hypothetical protein